MGNDLGVKFHRKINSGLLGLAVWKSICKSGFNDLRFEKTTISLLWERLPLVVHIALFGDDLV